MKIMFRYLFLFCLILIMTSCQSEKQNSPGTNNQKKVEGIKVEGGSVAEIIRNPVSANEPMDTTNLAKMVFEEKRYDFGTVNEGDIVRHVYKFTNTGTVPLIINEAKSTCGCTVPEWPKNPIKPGGTGEISVRFDTKHKTEKQAKPITIFANTYPNQIVLHLKGTVIPANK